MPPPFRYKTEAEYASALKDANHSFQERLWYFESLTRNYLLNGFYNTSSHYYGTDVDRIGHVLAEAHGGLQKALSFPVNSPEALQLWDDAYEMQVAYDSYLRGRVGCREDWRQWGREAGQRAINVLDQRVGAREEAAHQQEMTRMNDEMTRIRNEMALVQQDVDRFRAETAVHQQRIDELNRERRLEMERDSFLRRNRELRLQSGLRHGSLASNARGRLNTSPNINNQAINLL